MEGFLRAEASRAGYSKGAAAGPSPRRMLAMGWSTLGTQFLLELGFGVLVALAFVARAPLGTFFFRLMGTTAALPIAIAAVLPPLSGELAWTTPSVVLAGLSVLAWPVYSGPVAVRRRAPALLFAIACAGAALVHVVATTTPVSAPADVAVASLSALSTGCVAGTVGLAMVLGHWYLTIPNLEVAHLVRLNRVTVWAMVVSLGAVALAAFLLGDLAPATERPLFGMWGLFYLGTRVAVGLLLPLLFAWMTAESLRVPNTRSATGILYASTVLVLIGTAVSISLQDSYGVPL